MGSISVLIVDNDLSMIETIRNAFEKERWSTLITTDIAKIINIVGSSPLDLLLLSDTFSDTRVLQLCRHIRKFSQIPIIVIRPQSSSEEKIEFLNLGADEYITKPINTDELVAQIKAVLRRAGIESRMTKQPHFDDGYLTVDFSKRKVTAGGKEVRLTLKEYTLLTELIVNKGNVLTYNQLLEAVWGSGYRDARENVHDYVNSLRCKIEHDPHTPKYIINLRGVGYRFNTTQ